eukprot:7502849-Lingulodinium_polyedra.AAC.1
MIREQPSGRLQDEFRQNDRAAEIALRRSRHAGINAGESRAVKEESTQIGRPRVRWGRSGDPSPPKFAVETTCCAGGSSSQFLKPSCPGGCSRRKRASARATDGTSRSGPTYGCPLRSTGGVGSSPRSSDLALSTSQCGGLAVSSRSQGSACAARWPIG